MAESNQPTDNKTYLEVLEMLSPREVEVLKLVEKGLKNREIADQLYLSIRTVHGHRRTICSKLNLKGRHGLVKWILKVRNGDH